MPSGRERWAGRAAHTRWTMLRHFAVDKAKWTPIVKPEQGCGDSTWQNGNQRCFILSGYNMQNLPQRAWGALLSSPAIATTRYPREARKKMTFKCRIQLCFQPRESPFHWLDHFLSLLEPAQGFREYVQPGNRKKLFTVSRMASSCYWAKALLFPVLIHYIKVVRDGDKNNKVIKETQMTRAD